MDDFLSSPDPLNDAPPYRSPTKPRVYTRPRRSFPLEGSSPTKQTFELDVGNQISSQKIRVTVEAGTSDTENMYTHTVQRGRASPSPARRPANRRGERTTTTTVPVKGLSDSEEEHAATPKRGRGRPRKSIGTPVPAKKRGRAVTPIQKTKTGRKSISTVVNDDLGEGEELILGEGVELGRGKGRSRSRSIKGRPRNSTPAAHASTAPSGEVVSRSTSRKGKGRRKSLVPEEILVLEDESSGSLVNNEAQEGSGTDNVLSSIDSNGPGISSAYSTIRSTTTAGYSEPDITIARFDGMGPPVQTGWSSPRVINAPRVSSSNRETRKRPSSKSSSTAIPNPQEEEGCIDLVPVSPERNARTRDSQSLADDAEIEDKDVAGEYREFDTIIESEGFSMISVDSVPSLRDQFSSPANNGGEKELPPSIKNKAIRSLQESAAADEGDSFSSIPDDVLEAATPGRRTSSNTLSVPVTRINDSFSSIPPDILEAATPARPSRKTKASKFLATVNAHVNDSFSSIAPEILEAATPGRELQSMTAPLQVQGRRTTQTSFPAIPSPGLGQADRELSFARGSTQQNNQASTSRRLPTPEDTPPPIAVVNGIQSTAPPKEIPIAPAVTSGDDSLVLSQIRSSPPSIAPRRYTYTAHIRQQRDLYPDKTQTPSIVFSSPSLPPPIQLLNGRPTFTSQLAQPERPKLSTIIDAGRALQGLVVTLPPRVRAHSLGSPFKSPLVERNSSSSASLDPAGSPTQSRRARPLPKFDLAGNLSWGQSKQSIWNSTVRYEDPFGNNAPSQQQQRSPSPEEKRSYSLGLPEERRISDLRRFGLRSDNDSIRSDDAMSWQAEEEISLSNTSTSAAKAGISVAAQGLSSVSGADHADFLEQRWAAEREAVKRQIETANNEKVVVIDSDEEQMSEVNGDEDAEFGLLLETLNSSSPVAPAQPKVSNAERPRRSKIPSPWRKNSKRLVYNDELSDLSTPPASTQQSSGKSVVEDDEAEAELDLSEFIIPQKAGFKPRIRERANLDLSALLAPSPNKAPLPILTKVTQNTSSVYHVSSLDEAPALTETTKDSSQALSQGFGSIPQKLDFTSRIRERSLSGGSMFFSSAAKLHSVSGANGIFGSKSSKTPPNQPTPELISSSSDLRPLGLSSPSRNNNLTAPKHQHVMDNVSQPLNSGVLNSATIVSHEEKENLSTEKRTLKWTETVSLASVAIPSFVSPTKSCLRTPLKIPGSGVLNNPSPSKNVAFVSSSPTPSSPITRQLSATLWSREHWTLLDSILQNWKPEQRGGEERRRRNSTRVISKLLGKNVNFNGEKMKLQQWHLEVVDEFRGHVDGWQEADIAKRVFALLVGEEKRGLVKSGRANLVKKQVV